MTRATSRFDSPFSIGAIATLLAGAFALLRFAVAAHGHIAAFILLGTLHTDPSRLPRGVSVHSLAGYDGQFYYRLALDPLDWAHSGFGIRFDSIGRIQRIGYPAITWIFSAGQGSVVPTMLVVVNVIGVGVLAGLCAALAKEARRHPGWGLLMAGYWGFLWTISRDLTEILATMFVVAGLLAIRRNRNLLAALSLSAAVLTRETVLVLLLALLASRVFEFIRRRGSGVRSPVGISSRDLTWFVPFVSFAIWQVAVRLETGKFPIRASGSANAGLPFVGISRGLRHYVPLLPSTASLLWCGEFLALVVIGALAVFSLRSSTALLHERVAWLGYAILSICLSSGIWTGDVGFRSLDEFFVFSCLLLLFSKMRLTLPGLVTTAAWVVVAVELIRFI